MTELAIQQAPKIVFMGVLPAQLSHDTNKIAREKGLSPDIPIPISMDDCPYLYDPERAGLPATGTRTIVETNGESYTIDTTGRVISHGHSILRTCSDYLEDGSY